MPPILPRRVYTFHPQTVKYCTRDELFYKEKTSQLNALIKKVNNKAQYATALKHWTDPGSSIAECVNPCSSCREKAISCFVPVPRHRGRTERNDEFEGVVPLHGIGKRSCSIRVNTATGPRKAWTIPADEAKVYGEIVARTADMINTLLETPSAVSDHDLADRYEDLAKLSDKIGHAKIKRLKRPAVSEPLPPRQRMAAAREEIRKNSGVLYSPTAGPSGTPRTAPQQPSARQSPTPERESEVDGEAE
ncbi:hypothetical protein BCR39DRAFT_505334 [Naematelia encephala]|uniref:Uncharacterized protein n=1 Tax=Naematelia encephala TaxID=71784 RepID=A0A1Y2B5N0_9TREE|nr:hypothetical protein BCR39DRAFT_505334 [Naematelia encephala]